MTFLSDSSLARMSSSAVDLADEGQHLGEQLVALQAGQPLQPHVEDVLGLLLREARVVLAGQRLEARLFGPRPRRQRVHRALRLAQVDPRQRLVRGVLVERRRDDVHQRPAGLVRVLRGADDADDVVQEVAGGGGHQQALHRVQALLGLAQLEAAAPRHHLAAVCDEALQHLLERQRARLALVDGQHHDAVADLHRGGREQVVEHHLGDGVALQVDDHAHADAVGLVANVADALQLLVVDQVRHLLDQDLLLELEGNLGDDDAVAARCARRSRFQCAPAW